MSILPIQLRTLWALGLFNIARVGSYRIAMYMRLHPVQRLRGISPQGIFFRAVAPGLQPLAVLPVSEWESSACLFGRWTILLDSRPPDWHSDPLSGWRVPDSSRVWWRIPDFDPRGGDIKRIWELSRFDWVLAWAQRARLGDVHCLARLNDWLADWCRSNSPYFGPNWKCGQEASIRVMHLAMAAQLLGQVSQPAPALCELVRLHLLRIAPTMSYAIGQDNNHGTSEAAALFIGGSWLQTQGVPCASHWAALGRRWLENRAARLIADDGSFSQYSLNYHRVMLDTYSMAEVWRRQLNLPVFSERLQTRLRAASTWMRQMINPENGDGPNLGANDGARLLPLTDTPYRDYRPSLQLATVLYTGRRAYAEPGVWDYPLQWLGLPLPHDTVSQASSGQADAGGYAMLRRGAIMAMLRYPRFRFRPSQADALHLDLWHGSANLLRDAGSYSYNSGVQWLHYFGGTAGHNTVQFDDRDQMPRLGRFLFGDWLRTTRLEPLVDQREALCFAAGYHDQQGASHYRSVSLSDTLLCVVDEIDGFAYKAVLRWRLKPGLWRQEGNGVTDGTHSLFVQADMPIVRCELVEGWESRHYLERTSLPVFEVEVRQPGILHTHYRWAA